MTNFHLNTTVVAIFPNVCLWRRLFIEPPSYSRRVYVVAIWPSFLYDSFGKIWATCEIFLGKWFTAPPWQKISRTPMVCSLANLRKYILLRKIRRLLSLPVPVVSPYLNFIAVIEKFYKAVNWSERCHPFCTSWTRLKEVNLPNVELYLCRT